MKKTFKNLLKTAYPFSNIAPGGKATIELTGPDDIHLLGVKNGWLVDVTDNDENEKPQLPVKPKKVKGKR